MTPLHIEIWSDFVCPFCYIGKRNLETALSRFPGRERVRITWRSFELDPSPERDASVSLYQRLADKYGRDLAWARSVSDHTTAIAKAAGLTFHYDRAVPANTFDAHRVSHLAAPRGLQDRVEERLMAAYFTEGRNLADRETLAALAADAGLDAAAVRAALAGDAFAADVRRDEAAARAIGVHAVPFFLINGQVPVSGAQPPEVFLAALESAAADAR